MNKLELMDGKYTVINELHEGGGFRALRYGEEWRSLSGDNLVLAMYHEIERVRMYIAGRPSNCIGCGDSFSPGFDSDVALYYCQVCKEDYV